MQIFKFCDTFLDYGGLMINCGVRQFMRHPTDVRLNVLDRLIRCWAKNLTDRTLLCAARDFQPGSVDDYSIWSSGCSQLTETKKLDELRSFVMGLYLTRQEDWQYSYIQIGYDMDAIKRDQNSPGIFKTRLDYINWVESAKFPDIPYMKGRVQLTKQYLPDLNELCIMAAEYAVLRQTYIPSCVVEFVIANCEYLTADTKKKILTVIQDDEENYSDWQRVWEKFK